MGGWLELSGRWPLLELAEPLTSSVREVSRTVQPDGSTAVHAVEAADDELYPDGVTIHGLLRKGPRLVSLVGARTVGRTAVMGGPVRDPGEQRLRADYVLLGGHVAGKDATFTRAKLRLRHLNAWAQLPGMEISVASDGSQGTVTYEQQEVEAAEVAALSGTLTLDSALTVPYPTVRGAALTRTAELRIDLTVGMTLDALWRRFVAPLADLMTLAVDHDCPPAALEVYSQDADRWLRVRRLELKEPASELLDIHEVLLTRLDLGVGHLAAWLNAARALRPIPSLVAEVNTSPDRTLVNQLLEMAIAAEGLHRRLWPKHRVMSLGQAEDARRLGRNAVPAELRDRVNAALLHLEEPSYAERLHLLTDLVDTAVPDATGHTEEWERRIKAVRNGFAHQVVPARTAAGDGDDNEWREYVVLLRTLRWVLTGALLLQCGLDRERLATKLRGYEPYRHLLRQARRWLPNLFPSPA